MSSLTTLTGRDLVDAEVFRKRLENLTTEMAITLGRTSGSVHVTDSKDFSTALFDADGDQIGFSGWVSFHVASSLLAVRAVIDNHDLNDIAPGDIFICNDPYVGGAMHQGDVGIVMPFFAGDELVGWGFVNEHVADVGGTSIGGMAPAARDVFSESLRFPAIRIGRGHRIESNWRRYLEASVRVPGPVLNDLQSMVAGNNVGQEKLLKLIDRYGLQRFRALTETSKDLTERAFRQLIREIPDGVYRARDWCEYDGHGEDLLLDLELELTVRGDEMRFAFSSGTPQIDAFVNGARGAVLGQCMAAVLCQLAYDIPVNAGIWRPLEFDLGPAGTVVNPTPPAPVSNAHMEVGMRVSKLTVAALSQACVNSANPTIRGRIAGQPHDGFPVAILFGPNQHGQPWVSVFQDPAVGVGAGAQTVGDGLDCAGAHCMLGCGMPDVEVQESLDPKLFIYRRLNRASSGPGWQRGGLGLEEAVIHRGSSGNAGVGMSSVERVPPQGFGGGLPGGASEYFVIRGSSALAQIESGHYPALSEPPEGWPRQPSKTADLNMVEGDVMVLRGGGGAGLGDPLFRPAEAVAADLRDGYITETVVSHGYGVVIRDRNADEAASQALRHSIRVQRLGHKPERAASSPPLPGVAALLNDGHRSCAACGLALSSGSTTRTVAVVDALGELGLHVRSRPAGLSAVLLQHEICPGCGSLLSSEMCLERAGQDCSAVG
jgi:N-methylhydantoinase B